MARHAGVLSRAVIGLAVTVAMLLTSFAPSEAAGPRPGGSGQGGVYSRPTGGGGGWQGSGGGGYRGGHRYAYSRGYGHGHSHGSSTSWSFYVGPGGFGWPGYWYPYRYPYAYPYSYPYPYPYAYPYYGPGVVVEAPQVYVEQAPAQQQTEQQYWYYCENPQGYYPYVQQCPGGWKPVAPRPAER